MPRRQNVGQSIQTISTLSNALGQRGEDQKGKLDNFQQMPMAQDVRWQLISLNFRRWGWGYHDDIMVLLAKVVEAR